MLKSKKLATAAIAGILASSTFIASCSFAASKEKAGCNMKDSSKMEKSGCNMAESDKSGCDMKEGMEKTSAKGHKEKAACKGKNSCAH
jgi:hypothetical protein